MNRKQLFKKVCFTTNEPNGKYGLERKWYRASLSLDECKDEYMMHRKRLAKMNKRPMFLRLVGATTIFIGRI